MQTLLLSTFSRNMLKDPDSLVEIKSIPTKDARALINYGCKCHTREDISKEVSNELRVHIQYGGTKYLQLEPYDRVVIAKKLTSSTFEYSQVIIKRKHLSIFDWVLGHGRLAA